MILFWHRLQIHSFSTFDPSKTEADVSIDELKSCKFGLNPKMFIVLKMYCNYIHFHLRCTLRDIRGNKCLLWLSSIMIFVTRGQMRLQSQFNVYKFWALFGFWSSGLGRRVALWMGVSITRSIGVGTENGGGMSFLGIKVLLESTRWLGPICRGWKDSTSVTVESI
jgi:hypothetical protein